MCMTYACVSVHIHVRANVFMWGACIYMYEYVYVFKGLHYECVCERENMCVHV